MKVAYLNLKKYKRAYVVCAAGQSYIDSSEGIVKALAEFSKYPIILYYSDGVVNYNYDNLIKQPFRLTGSKVDLEHTLKLFTTLKAEVTLNSIKRYDVETIVMLDSDIIPTPSMDTVFDKYENEIENYPIFLKYAWNIVYVMGRPLVSDYIQNTIITSNPKIPAVCSCMCIANKNCVSFLEDWKYWCENEKLINYHYIENKDIYYDFNDESIVNALLWKYSAEKYIPCDLMWAWKHHSVKFAFDFYEGKVGELNMHESNHEHYRVPEEFEVPYGLSVLPKSKRNLLGFHGPKNINEINLIIDEIKKRF
jgi:hypothetical protein